jgi:hypothetical protein
LHLYNYTSHLLKHSQDKGALENEKMNRRDGNWHVKRIRGLPDPNEHTEELRQVAAMKEADGDKKWRAPAEMPL